MATLVYKRTHPFDPNAGGIFGIEDCMGTIRNRSFENVIGIGGICAEAKRYRIDRKINWIGIGAHIFKKATKNSRGPMIAFEHFLLLEENGPRLEGKYPKLAELFLHPKAPRSVLHAFKQEHIREINRILALAKDAPPSTGDMTRGRPWPCQVKCRPKGGC